MKYKINIWNSGDNSLFVYFNNKITKVLCNNEREDIELGYITNNKMLEILLFDNKVELESNYLAENYEEKHVTIINKSKHDIILIDEPIADEYILKKDGEAVLVFQSWNYEVTKKSSLFLEMQLGKEVSKYYVSIYNQDNFPFDILMH